MSKILREEAVLRAVIRGMLNEAPYRQSPVVRLGTVQSPGLSVKQILTAGGFLALSKAYTWLSNICDGKHEKFPIIKSEPKAEELKRAKATGQNLSSYEALFASYQDTIAARGTGKKTSGSPGNIEVNDSDLAAAQALYDATLKAAAAWPSGSDIAGLSDNDVNAVHGALMSVLLLYTGCNEAVLQAKFGQKGNVADIKQKFPLKTRQVYIQFIGDVTDNTHSSFQDGIEKQRQDLRGTYAATGDQASIDKVCNASLAVDNRSYKYAIDRIK